MAITFIDIRLKYTSKGKFCVANLGGGMVLK